MSKHLGRIFLQKDMIDFIEKHVCDERGFVSAMISLDGKSIDIVFHEYPTEYLEYRSARPTLDITK